jgi:hypothetical protein
MTTDSCNVDSLQRRLVRAPLFAVAKVSSLASPLSNSDIRFKKFYLTPGIVPKL